MNLRIEWIRMDVCFAFTCTAIPADAGLLNGYVLNGYVLKAYVLVGYVLNGYVLVVMLIRQQSSEEPCDETSSGKNKLSEDVNFLNVLPFQCSLFAPKYLCVKCCLDAAFT